MQIRSWLVSRLADPRCLWSMGAFGVVAGFAAGEADPPELGLTGALIRTGIDAGVRLDVSEELRPVAFEVLSSDPRSWNHGVALCLPRGPLKRPCRRTVTELGDDTGPLLGSGRLFDLGLGLPQADICVRADDGRLIVALRGLEGLDGRAQLPQLAALLAAHDHVRVTATPIGRIEARQRPGPAPSSLPGVIPQLLGSGRTHAATTPVPDGLVPFGYVFPPHPLRHRPGRPKAFDRADHDAFQDVLRMFGPPRLVALKRRLTEAVLQGSPPQDMPAPADRFESACLRVALRQMAWTHPSAALGPWLARFDRPAAGLGRRRQGEPR